MARADCPVCKKSVALTSGGKFFRHLVHGEPCDTGGTLAKLELPPSQPPPRGEIYTPPAPLPFSQPGKIFSQPARVNRVVTEARPMTEKGAEIAARLKETFYAYTNRKTADNRSAQTTLGPSEIGTPCDRRLAMSLLRIPAVNPGGDGWAAFVGTCVHEGLARMFEWAGADSGRYAVEVPLAFPSEHVPRGTGDLLDRTLCLFLDHKIMGRWSLDKLKTGGPSQTYRVQVHCYAYAARIRGEAVEDVAIIGWPREGSSLDDLYVWTEPYDPTVARDALDRVERIYAQLQELGGPDAVKASEVPEQFPIADDCTWCKYHMPGAKDSKQGACNGRA